MIIFIAIILCLILWALAPELVGEVLSGIGVIIVAMVGFCIVLGLFFAITQGT